MSRRHIQIRKRIVRLFVENNRELLSTKEIEEMLQTQKQSRNSTKGRDRLYQNNPTMNELSNVLRKHPEFEKTKYKGTAGAVSGGNYDICIWQLSEEAEELL